MDISLEYCKLLPKIELHAHLSGSVREETIIQLLQQESKSKNKNSNNNNNDNSDNKDIDSENVVDYKLCEDKFVNEFSTFKLGDRNLNECFVVFKILHRLLNNLDILYTVTKQVISDFKSDNVVYLELRTTPRKFNNSTKLDYINTVIKAIKECELLYNNSIIVRLLLSIDRTQTLEDATETLELALNNNDNYIVGLDFSGNPTIN